MTESIVGFAVLFALILAGMPISYAMGIVGVAGSVLFIGLDASVALVGHTTFDAGLAYELSIVPLFILMGNFVTTSKLSEELYDASQAFLGHLRGGLAMATIVASGGFSAVCGSSLATAATMSKVAIPSMRRFGYADSLAAGAVASGGTLGILIPPSVMMIIYGIMTNTNIGKLFIAGILPGILGILLYCAAVSVLMRWRPEQAPPVERMGWAARFAALRGVIGVIVLFSAMIFGMYGGIFTPNEAGGVGATGAFLISVYRRGFSLRDLLETLLQTARTTASIFTILIGAMLFSQFINLTGMPDQLGSLITREAPSPWVIMLAIIVVYILLGCIMESLSMMLLTIPIFFPIVAGLGFDPIWFGVIIVVLTEISLITPPTGLNAFIVKSAVPDLNISTVFRGIAPFFLADIVRLGLLLGFPAISLILPMMMK